MTGVEQQMKALESFKDWSNYLLVANIAAIGWVASENGQANLDEVFAKVAIAFLGLSLVFAMFTLASIPVVAQQIDANTKSFYEVEFNPLERFGKHDFNRRLRFFCLPQHGFLVAAILVYSLGVIVH
jgi:hypothetical protein